MKFDFDFDFLFWWIAFRITWFIINQKRKKFRKITTTRLCVCEWTFFFFHHDIIELNIVVVVVVVVCEIHFNEPLVGHLNSFVFVVVVFSKKTELKFSLLFVSVLLSYDTNERMSVNYDVSITFIVFLKIRKTKILDSGKY